VSVQAKPTLLTNISKQWEASLTSLPQELNALLKLRTA